MSRSNNTARQRLTAAIMAAAVGLGIVALALVSLESEEASGQPRVKLKQQPSKQPASPKGQGGLTMKLRFDRAVVPMEEQRGVAMVEVVAPEGARRQRRPLAVVILVDASGSMAGNKINNARESAAGLVDRLDIGDTLSVLSFDGRVTAHVFNRRLGKDREAIKRKVRQIEDGGSTCISCGLTSAYTILSSATEGHTRRVVLLSDGGATTGLVRPAQLRHLASRALQDRQVTTVGIGIGRGYDVNTMAAITGGGAGPFYFVHNSKVIASVLDRELAAVRAVTVSQLTLALVPSKGVFLGEVAVPSIRRGDGGLVVTLGDLSAGQRRRLLVPLVLKKKTLGTVIRAQATYLQGDWHHTTEARGVMRRSAVEAQVEASVDEEVLVEQARVASADQIERALEDYSRGLRHTAAARLKRHQTWLERQQRRCASPVLLKKLEEVQEVLTTISHHAPGSNEGIIALRLNKARNQEIRRGVDVSDIYHGNQGVIIATELE